MTAILITAGEALLLLTLLEPMHLPPTLLPGFDSLDPPCPDQEAPHSLRQQGSWTHQAGEEPVDIMFLPRNGKVGMFLGKEQSSGTSTPGNIHSPFPLPRASPSMLGSVGRKTHRRDGQVCLGPLARPSTHLWRIQSHTLISP